MLPCPVVAARCIALLLRDHRKIRAAVGLVLRLGTFYPIRAVVHQLGFAVPAGRNAVR